jgi:sec-independent protein translocase protein TatB
MFDVGFSEMVVIGVVALIVIGPEKLPRVARTVGALIGRMQRYVNDVKADINREIELDELKKLHTSVKDAAHSIETTMKETISSFESHATELNTAVSGATPAPEISNQELEKAIAAADTHAAAHDAPAVTAMEEPSPQASLPLEPMPEPPAPVHHADAAVSVYHQPEPAAPVHQAAPAAPVHQAAPAAPVHQPEAPPRSHEPAGPAH